jgi:iron complex outermembrane receptor protein
MNKSSHSSQTVTVGRARHRAGTRDLAVAFAAVLAASALIGADAVAQTSTPASTPAKAGQLEEIIVTARYQAELLQETPIAITAIPASELTERAFTSSFELGYTVPNTTLRPAQQAYGNTMTAYIRGIGQYDFDFAFEPGVGIYIDDVYHPFTLGSEVDLLDLERVEVLRGPQGTLFGRGAIGGVIRYVSKPATGDNSGYVQVTGGEFSRVDVRAGYDFSLIPDQLFARITGVSKKRDGYQDVIDFACAHPDQAGNLNPRSTNRGDNCKVGTQGGEDVIGARATLRWVPSDLFESTTTYEYMDDSSEARADYISHIVPTGSPEAGLLLNLYQANYLTPVLGIQYDERFLTHDPFRTYATFDDPRSGLSFKPETSFEKWSISERADLHFSDQFNIAAIVSYSDLQSHFATDADGSPLNLQTVNGSEDINVFTGELRFSGRLADRMDWTVGGFYYDGNAVNDQVVSIPFLSMFLDQFLPNRIGPCIVCGTLTFEQAAALLDSDPATYTFVNAHNVHDSTSYAGFANVVFDLTDRWTLNAGVRQSKDKKDVNFDNTRVQNPSVVVENDHFDWKAGVDFKPTDNVMLYATAASGYRPGAYNSRPFQWTQVVAVDQEEADSYELGVKADLFDRTLRANLAAFYIDYSTRILPVAGTECPVLNDPPGPPIYATVPPDTPGAVQDSLGNYCLTTVSRTNYQNGPAEIEGVELELTWRPIAAFTLQGQFGWLDWKSDDIEHCDFNFDGVPDPNTTCISDLPSQVPDLNWSIGGSYAWDLGTSGSLTPRVDVYGQSEICFGPAINALATKDDVCDDGYELVNVSLMWASAENGWRATLGVTNVTDEEYVLNSFPLTSFGQPHSEKQPGRPSEWFLTLEKDF